MIDRFKSLKNLDRKRLDAALMRIQGRPAMMTLFNLGLLAINSMSGARRIVKQALNKLGIINRDSATATESFNFLPEPFENTLLNMPLSVLIVCEVSIPQCLRYRVEQKIEQLELLGLNCRWMNWIDYFEVKNQIHFHDVIIFYRVPGYPKAMANINYANRLGKIVIYDTDDLIYDRENLASYYGSGTAQLSAKELNAVLKGADIYKTAIEACEYAITTTPALKSSLEILLGHGKVYILPNALDRYSIKAAKSIRVVKNESQITLFYGSGSNTHDEDFALITPALRKLFEQFSNLHLLVVGYLTLPDELKTFANQITQIKFLELDEYFHVLAHADVNMAPLKPGLFADCKSEIKWLEAGMLRVPTVTSETRVYQQAIRHGHDGFVARDTEHWYGILHDLIRDESLRQRIGEAAREKALQNYSSSHMSECFKDILEQISTQHRQKSGQLKPPKNLKHIVVVNVLYPPLAMGGATVIAENIVNSLHRDYATQYRVSVFTCDITNIYAYQIKEYEHRGVNVTAVSVPVGPDVDSRPLDEYIESIFGRYLDYRKPDLIHFHSIQHLTASMLVASIKRDIPFVVTVHDAWWLSDHQFLVDSEGQPVDPLQSNVIVAARTSGDLQQTLQRSTRLKQLLNQAKRVLAVSRYQADFYRKNGIRNVVVNGNGVDAPDMDGRRAPVVKNQTEVILGYSGSVCHHKGYYFLKEIIENTPLSGLHLKVINFGISEPVSEHWNQTRVEFLPKFDSADMVDFFRQIDVLIAPSMWPESFGLITREAALAGIWVVASDAGGLAEHVKQGKNGYKYDLGNADQLRAILVEINANPERFKSPVPSQDRNTAAINSVNQQMADLVRHYSDVLSDDNI